MPARFRPLLEQHCAGQLVTTVNLFDKCLTVYPLPEWEVLERKLTRLPFSDRRALRYKRLLMGYADSRGLDGQGRILLPPELREFAAIDKRVVLVGQGDKFEVWDETHWNAQCQEWLAADESEGGPLPDYLANL